MDTALPHHELLLQELLDRDHAREVEELLDTTSLLDVTNMAVRTALLLTVHWAC